MAASTQRIHVLTAGMLVSACLSTETAPPRTTPHRWSCPRALIPCSQSARGCPAVFPRDGLAEHLKACQFEALAAFFVANDARFAAIESQHDELRAENEGLRAELWNARRGAILPRALWEAPQAAGEVHVSVGPTQPQSLDPARGRPPASFLQPPPRVSYTDWVLDHLHPPSARYSDLRASILHLAAGLDASERRTEV